MIPRSAFHDRALKKVLFGSVRAALDGIGQPVSRLRWLLKGQLDPNDWRLVQQNAVGIGFTPLTPAITRARVRGSAFSKRHGSIRDA